MTQRSPSKYCADGPCEGATKEVLHFLHATPFSSSEVGDDVLYYSFLATHSRHHASQRAIRMSSAYPTTVGTGSPTTTRAHMLQTTHTCGHPSGISTRRERTPGNERCSTCGLDHSTAKGAAPGRREESLNCEECVARTHHAMSRGLIPPDPCKSQAKPENTSESRSDSDYLQINSSASARTDEGWLRQFYRKPRLAPVLEPGEESGGGDTERVLRPSFVAPDTPWIPDLPIDSVLAVTHPVLDKFWRPLIVRGQTPPSDSEPGTALYYWIDQLGGTARCRDQDAAHEQWRKSASGPALPR